MNILISAAGKGLAAILGAGAILLALIGNQNWPFFLIVAILVFSIGKFRF